MDPLDILARFYKPGSVAYKILIEHGQQVAEKAVDTAGKVFHLNPDITFIKEAAMLHDIGILMTHTPELGCTGKHPYVCHGYLGRKMLENMGLHAHGLVCERHVGVGLTVEDIRVNHLPLPQRDMIPVSIDEKIICFADKFFSKNGKYPATEKSVADILNNLERYSHDKAMIFRSWVDFFK